MPEGAEALLETRLPYLDAAQRRVVLRTTALPSAYPALDDAEGWGRLVLFAAADGFGAFNGGTEIDGGVLRAASTNALGTGDVYLAGATLVSGAAAPLAIAGGFTALSAGALELDVVFVPGHVPSVGDTLDVIGAGKLQGRFATISVTGFKVTPTYTATGLSLRIDG